MNERQNGKEPPGDPGPTAQGRQGRRDKLGRPIPPPRGPDRSPRKPILDRQYLAETAFATLPAMTRETDIPLKIGRYTTRACRQLAARVFVETGSPAEAAKACGVTNGAVQRWLRREDFRLDVEAYTRQLERRQSALLRQAADKAIRRMIQTLDEGEQRMASGGAVVTVPVTGRDAAMMAGVAFDKLRLAEGRPTRITADVARIAAVRGQMKALATSWREGAIDASATPAPLPGPAGGAPEERGGGGKSGS